MYASSTPKTAGGEWLFDMTWIEQSEGYLLSLPLVLESEWSPEGSSEDFQKILVARADHRVMVLTCNPSRPPQDAIDVLIQEVDQCKLSQYGDRYLFACWEEPAKEFSFMLHVVGWLAA